MPRFSFAIPLAVLVLGFASPAWAPGGKDWARAPDAVPPPPPSVALCKTDQALLSRCGAEWNNCQSKARNKSACREQWNNCCHHKAVRRR
jgi:hypothetical protein